MTKREMNSKKNNEIESDNGRQRQIYKAGLDQGRNSTRELKRDIKLGSGDGGTGHAENVLWSDMGT
jgi:hypothetical protein